MAKNLNRVPHFGLAVDWETSGYTTPNYAQYHQGISFGAIIFDVKTLTPVEEIYREIKFDPKYRWESGAEKVHGISRDRLLNGVTQEEAATELANLVVKYIGTEDLMLLGHRVHFDRAFTTQLMMEGLGFDFNYHPTVIDSCSMATVLMELTYSEDVFQTLGLPPRGKHNALEDIQYTLESVKRMKEFFITGVTVSLENM